MKDYSKYSDIELVTLLKENGAISDNAFNTIYLKYSSQTYGYCIYRSESVEDAQELMQDMWMKFYNSIKSGKTTDNILPYLFKTAQNLNIDRYRRNKSIKQIDTEPLNDYKIELIADPFNFQNNIEKEEFNTLVKIAINNLDEIYKESVALYWFGGLLYSEIASIVNETEQCIRTRMYRAFKILAKLLKPYLEVSHNNSEN
jgi:RNA polymerase sigma-70 factor (ECF subfamily)